MPMTNLTKRLSGWQRLWVVCGAIYLAIVIGIAAQSIPHALTTNEYLGETVDGGDSFPTEIRKYVRIDNRWVRVEQTATNKNTGEQIYLLNGKWSEPTATLESATIPRTLSDDDIWTLRKKQAGFILRAFLSWLVPWALLYLCGLAVVWIIDGFRGGSK